MRLYTLFFYFITIHFDKIIVSIVSKYPFHSFHSKIVEYELVKIEMETLHSSTKFVLRKKKKKDKKRDERKVYEKFKLVEVEMKITIS